MSSFRRCPAPLTALVFLLAVSACDRPLVVNIDTAGAKRMTLRGELEVEGTLKRSIQNGDRLTAKGVAVVVQETWLIRREKADPPAYRILGLYDPAKAAEGLTLPVGSLDVIYMGSVLPDRVVQVLVPADEFERR
jgi:hypothetical protein